MPGLKQQLGEWLIPRLPVNPWLFWHLRIELRATWMRLLHRIHPGWIAKRAHGWDTMNRVVWGDNEREESFPTKALNHVFVQGGEHYGGFDEKYLARTLSEAGFRDVTYVRWRQGRFPDGAIDREQHRSYSLYMEAVR